MSGDCYVYIYCDPRKPFASDVIRCGFQPFYVGTGRKAWETRVANGNGKASEGTKAKMSATLRGRPKPEGFGERVSRAKMGHEVSQETRDKIAKTLTGSRHTDEAKRKISEALTRRKMSESLKEKLRASVSERVERPHCGVIGGRSAMKRHHFNNCKQKENPL
jgi:hypothetical protein